MVERMQESQLEKSAREFRNSLPDWILRGSIALLFVFIGTQKFPSGPDAPWVKLFGQVGFGQWLRYLTGMIEVLGGLLVLSSRTVNAGLVLLGFAMTGAVLVVVFVIHRPIDAFVAFAFLCALTGFWLRRRRN